MSYIRCLSNPEALYIYGDARGRIAICFGGVAKQLRSPWNRRKAGGCGPILMVPQHVFEGACRAWHQRGADRVTCRGLVVEELQVILKTGKQVTDKTPSFPDPKAPETAFLIRFSYRGQWFHMWRVTWEYIVNGVADRDKEPAEFD